MDVIPFNKPYLTGEELSYIQDALQRGHLSTNGYYTRLCEEFIETKFNFQKVILTHSCTAALEMAAIVANIQPGDEVIIPSFTYVSVANAFALRGAKLIMADNYPDHPNIDPDSIASLITKRTKVIVIVHYSGVGCDMEKILPLVRNNNLFLVEDAAHSIGATYNGHPLGSFGHLATFSFHETKNIHSGQGGMLVINDKSLVKRAEIIKEKGTDRSSFFRGEIDKYSWVDIGSAFQMSEVTAAFLWAQLQHLPDILKRRKSIWSYYQELFLAGVRENDLFSQANIIEGHNAHIFYLIFNSEVEREKARLKLLSKRIQAVFHYSPLHTSIMCTTNASCPNAEKIAATILRLPLFFELQQPHQDRIAHLIYGRDQ